MDLILKFFVYFMGFGGICFLVSWFRFLSVFFDLVLLICVILLLLVGLELRFWFGVWVEIFWFWYKREMFVLAFLFFGGFIESFFWVCDFFFMKSGVLSFWDGNCFLFFLGFLRLVRWKGGIWDLVLYILGVIFVVRVLGKEV